MKSFLKYLMALTVSLSAAWASASKLSSFDEIVEFMLGRHQLNKGLIDALKLNHLEAGTLAAQVQGRIERSTGALGSDSYLLRIGSNKSELIVDFVTLADLNNEVLSFTFYARDLVSINRWVDDINLQLKKKNIPVQLRKTGQTESVDVEIKTFKSFRATFKGLMIEIPMSEANLISADELKSLMNLIAKTKSPNAKDIEVF